MDYALIGAVALVVAALTLFSGFGLGTLLMPAFADTEKLLGDKIDIRDYHQIDCLDTCNFGRTTIRNVLIGNSDNPCRNCIRFRSLLPPRPGIKTHAKKSALHKTIPVMCSGKPTGLHQWHILEILVTLY